MSVARLVVDLIANTEQFKREMQSAAQTMDRTGRQMQQIGGAMTTRVTLPLAAIGAAAVKMSVDAEESANKFNVVMGEAADDVRQRFIGLQDTIPMTLSEMEKMAAGVQDFLVPLGFARREAAGMSADMVELAADLASFNNVAADVPLQAIQSALAGMSRPLRQFGVDVSQSRLELLALEEGLISAGEEMSNNARAQAIMIAVQRDSSDAMGDAARTADSAANQLRFLRRDVMDLAQGIGDILVPAVIPFVRHLRDAVNVFRDIDPQIQRIIVGVGALAAAIGPLLLVLGTMIRSMAALAVLVNPAGAIIVGLAAIATLLAGRYIRAKSEATRQTNEFEESLARAGRELRTFDEEAARVTFAQFQRNTLEAQATVQRLKAELEVFDTGAWREMGIPLKEAQSEAARLKSELQAAEQNLTASNRLLGEARDHYFSLADGAKTVATQTQAVGGAVADMRAHLAAALDLDIGRQEILDAALARRRELDELIARGIPNLEKEIDAIREREALDRAIKEHMERRIGLSDEVLAGAIALRTVTADTKSEVAEVTALFEEMFEGVQRAGEEAVEQVGTLGREISHVAIMGANAFGQFATGATGAFRRFFQQAMSMLAALIARMLLARAILSAFPGVGFALNVAGALAPGVLPTRHTGGPVRRGHPYLVRPDEEVFIPASDGRVQRSIDAGGAGAMNISLDMSSLPPRPAMMTPEAVATDDWWRRAFSYLKMDHDDRGGL
jgi:hypothetical protein